MLPFVTNSALGGGVQVAAFVQDRTQQQGGGWLGQHLPNSRSSCSFMTLPSRAANVKASATACGLLVFASACCPPRPRSGRLQACASRSKTRRRRSGSGSSGGDSDDSDFGADWPIDSWNSLYFGGYGGGDNSGSGGGGSGGWYHSWDSAGGDAFHQAVQHATWLWQLLCAASLLRSLYFLLFTDALAPVDAVTAGADHLQPVGLAC